MVSKKILGAIVVIIVILAGFGVVYYTEAAGNAVHKGNIYITVADNSTANITGVYVTFSKVSIKAGNNNWHTFSLHNETVNILVNATNQRAIGKFTLFGKTYTNAKMYISSVSVSVNNGTRTPYGLDSHYTTSNKTFRVIPHQETILLFDFNLNKDMNMTSHTFNPASNMYSSH